MPRNILQLDGLDLIWTLISSHFLFRGDFNGPSYGGWRRIHHFLLVSCARKAVLGSICFIGSWSSWLIHFRFPLILCCEPGPGSSTSQFQLVFVQDKNHVPAKDSRTPSEGYYVVHQYSGNPDEHTNQSSLGLLTLITIVTLISIIDP